MALVAPDQFKSYDDLKKPYGLCPGNQEASGSSEETEYDDYSEVESKKVSEEEVLKKLEDSYQHPRLQNPPRQSDDDDDPMSYFAKLMMRDVLKMICIIHLKIDI